MRQISFQKSFSQAGLEVMQNNYNSQKSALKDSQNV